VRYDARWSLEPFDPDVIAIQRTTDGNEPGALPEYNISQGEVCFARERGATLWRSVIGRH
jgi:hypothetical protein